MADFDVIVVGAGVTGCAVARELSRYVARVCVVERDEDVCCGTSKANSAIVHAGFDAPTGSLMARLNVEGNRLMYELSRDLDFACLPIGSLVVCTNEADRSGLDVLLERGRANGVPDLRVVGRDELLALEPNVSDAAVAALWAPTAGIVDPFGLTVSLAENAAANGVAFRFGTKVVDVRRMRSGEWELVCADGTRHTARSVVNAAGVYADELHNLVCRPDDQMRIVPRKGEYYLLDTTVGTHVRHTVFMLPGSMGKGVLVSPTVHGNLIVGPTADDVSDKEATATTTAGLAEVARQASIAVRDVPLPEVITTFAGLRAHEPRHEFFVGEVAGAPGFVDCAAIESPGLTSAPAIGRMVADIVRDLLGLTPKEGDAWVARRRGVVDLEAIAFEQWARLCEGEPRYGALVCRCRRVSEAQIVDAIRRVPQPRSLDAVKRRTGATMGRCQGGFCTPRIMELLADEVEGLSLEGVTKMGPGSPVVFGPTKGASRLTGGLGRSRGGGKHA